MTRTKRDYLWIPTFAVLVAFAVPWFLWGVDVVVAGLPIWIWWHVGWMVACALLFYGFTRGAWDRGMTFDADRAATADAAKSTSAAAAAETESDVSSRGGGNR